MGDARVLRLRQRDRGARRQDDGAHLARARLARDRPLRDADRDPDRRLHRCAYEPPKFSSSAGEGASTRSSARCSARPRPRRCSATRATRGSRWMPRRCCPTTRNGSPRTASSSWSSARRCRWSRATRTPASPRASRSSGRAPPPRDWRAPRPTPRRSWPPPASRPRATRSCSDVEAGLAAITSYPVVLKADGLAAGKGVVIAADEAEARATLEDMLVGQRFGDAPVVVEEYLDGVELSVLALCDGEIGAAAGPGAGLQAHRRGRHRPQHRRDGRVLARRGRRRGADRATSAAGSASPSSTSSPAAARPSTACSTRA